LHGQREAESLIPPQITTAQVTQPDQLTVLIQTLTAQTQATLQVQQQIVTPSFKGKPECIDHVCARIKLHTRLDIMNTKNSATRIKS
jgi:hypothetical protein